MPAPKNPHECEGEWFGLEDLFVQPTEASCVFGTFRLPPYHATAFFNSLLKQATIRAENRKEITDP